MKQPWLNLNSTFLFSQIPNYNFQPHLPPTKEEVYVFARVGLSVSLSVSKITQEDVHGFG